MDENNSNNHHNINSGGGVGGGGNVHNTAASGEEILNSYHLPRPLPLWLNSSYGKHIVKGNFMTLSARPKTVEPGEWIAHQGAKARQTIFNPLGGLGLTGSQSSNTIGTFGTLYASSTKRRMTALPFATGLLVPRCLLEGE